MNLLSRTMQILSLGVLCLIFAGCGLNVTYFQKGKSEVDLTQDYRDCEQQVISSSRGQYVLVPMAVKPCMVKKGYQIVNANGASPSRP